LLAAGLAARLPARAGEADHPRDGAPAPRSQPLGHGAAVGLRWDDWGEAAFARARETGRPLLLSLTARWCGACHRMDEETWDDPGVAARVAEVAVPVRVDADARPDVYGRYHLGGLPTTALLTADGDFLRGGTFLSPTQLFGLLDAAAADLREARRRPDAALEAIAREALDAIARHLVDPADGAFFRYGAADVYTSPHTEKVTLDQAALIRLFLEAERAVGDPAYGAVARRALAHARERLTDASGRVYASIAAQPAAEVDMRRFADASAALASAFLMAGAGSTPGSTSLPPVEFIAAAPDGAVPHRLDAPDAAGPRGLLRDQALAISAAVHAYRAAGDRARLDWAALAADWTIAHRWDAAAGAFLDAEPLAPARQRGQGQGAFTPITGNGEMAQALLALAEHAPPGDALAERGKAWRDHTGKAIATLAAQALRSPAGATLALAAQRLRT